MTKAAFENAIRVNAAIGGSTNAVIHLLAIAGRLGVPLALDDFDELARDVPTLVNLQPSGQYLMEDFCYAGGLPAVLRELAEAGLLLGRVTLAAGLVKFVLQLGGGLVQQVVRGALELGRAEHDSDGQGQEHGHDGYQVVAKIDH